MKTQIIFITIAIILFSSSCNSKTAGTIVNQSPDKNVTVTINATRPTAVDAWNVVIKVKAYSFKEGKLAFEVYADDLNDQNVKFDWSDNNNCVITVPVRDDKPRRFQLIANQDQVQVAEI
jgi:hypothetical protein